MGGLRIVTNWIRVRITVILVHCSEREREKVSILPTMFKASYRIINPENSFVN